jgi:hypothetical protein
MQCEEKALEIHSRKIPFVFSPPRRRFRKVLEGSSIYSFEASKMPPPPQGERGWVVTDFPNPTTIHCLIIKARFFFCEKALNDCKMADHLVLFLSQVFLEEHIWDTTFLNKVFSGSFFDEICFSSFGNPKIYIIFF